MRNHARPRTGRTERGQTLVIFALVLSLFLVWMIALVADVGALYVAYDRFDNAALLAAQAGASAVDTGQLYQGNLRLDVAQIEPAPEMITGVDTEYIRGVGKIEDRLIILLDLAKIITGSEKRELDSADVEAAAAAA